MEQFLQGIPHRVNRKSVHVAVCCHRRDYSVASSDADITNADTPDRGHSFGSKPSPCIHTHKHAEWYNIHSVYPHPDTHTYTQLLSMTACHPRRSLSANASEHTVVLKHTTKEVTVTDHLMICRQEIIGCSTLQGQPTTEWSTSVHVPPINSTASNFTEMLWTWV